MNDLMTRERIESKIKEKIFFMLPDGCTTICHVTMLNGSFVTGISTSELGNFNIARGKEVSFTNVLDQLWHFERYAIAEFEYLANRKTFVLSPIEARAKKSGGVWEDPIKQANAIREYIKDKNDAYEKAKEARKDLNTNAAPWGVKKDGAPRRKPGPRK